MPRPDLGPQQLVEAAKGDDAEKVVSLLGQGAPVDLKGEEGNATYA